MTMEDRSGGIERGVSASNAASNTNILDEITSDASYPIQRTASKRSFDVAFLVAPDENLTRRQNEKLRLQSTERMVFENKKDRARSDIVPEIIQVSDTVNDKIPQYLTVKHFDSDRTKPPKADSLSPSHTPYMSPKTLTPTLPGLSPEPEIRRFTPVRQQKSPSPPSPRILTLHQQQHQTLLGRVDVLDNSLVTNTISCGKNYDGISCSDRQPGESRSAFTKVSLSCQRSYDDMNQNSPRSSISPDRSSYQSSVSPPIVTPLPGVTTYKYAPSFPTAKMPYPFLVAAENQQTTSILENLKIPQIAQPPKVPSPKLTTFRPDLPAVYPNLPYNPISAVFPPMAEALARPRFLATGVAGLLPSSFAALSLPAQNVCAKCSLSFRMTSDLVYHMRSHHKNESAGEAARRRREEKLRCPVCDESFRERHHLTRHMTAHQDKESDAIVDQVEVKRRAATVHGK